MEPLPRWGEALREQTDFIDVELARLPEPLTAVLAGSLPVRLSDLKTFSDFDLARAAYLYHRRNTLSPRPETRLKYHPYTKPSFDDLKLIDTWLERNFKLIARGVDFIVQDGLVYAAVFNQTVTQRRRSACWAQGLALMELADAFRSIPWKTSKLWKGRFMDRAERLSGLLEAAKMSGRLVLDGEPGVFFSRLVTYGWVPYRNVEVFFEKSKVSFFCDRGA